MGYPAYAGIDLMVGKKLEETKGLPRIRGDRPTAMPNAEAGGWATPHTRGSTLPLWFFASPVYGYPAYAGIDLCRYNLRLLLRWLPRIRGDRPPSVVAIACRVWATPHTRGSTLTQQYSFSSSRGYPAYAGIDPSPTRIDPPYYWLPRIRGDRPAHRI